MGNVESKGGMGEGSSPSSGRGVETGRPTWKKLLGGSAEERK